MRNQFLLIIFSTLLLTNASFGHANTIKVAVASNFIHTLKQLASGFENTTGHTLKISGASTGKLYAQINHGAPFDVFMGADEARADLLIKNNMANNSLAHVYAIGRLAFISNIKTSEACQNILHTDKIKHLAIANPKIAPYGFAAKQVLVELKQWSKLEKKLVFGENIAQTLQFIATGNANTGFISLSMLSKIPEQNKFCIWIVPKKMHTPIKQKMVILNRSRNKIATQAFWRYIQSSTAQAIIKNNGYDIF